MSETKLKMRDEAKRPKIPEIIINKIKTIKFLFLIDLFRLALIDTF